MDSPLVLGALMVFHTKKMLIDKKFLRLGGTSLIFHVVPDLHYVVFLVNIRISFLTRMFMLLCESIVIYSIIGMRLI